jgi:hypothetical protein
VQKRGGEIGREEKLKENLHKRGENKPMKTNMKNEIIKQSNHSHITSLSDGFG